MIYGYARVSTRGQATGGNSLEDQERQLTERGCELIYKDAFTGSTTDRPALQRLMAQLKSGDTLMVTKLDRISRSINQGQQLISDLNDKGVTVHVLNLGVLDNTPSSNLIRNVFFSFAEFEREMILERTREGKLVAMEDPDYTEGRPEHKNKHKFPPLFKQVKDGILSGAEGQRILEVSKTTWYRWGRQWEAGLWDVEK